MRHGTPQQAAPLGANDDLYPAGAGDYLSVRRFEPVDRFDFAFRTYAIPIPGPHGYVLLLAGLFVTAFAVRRSRGA